MSEIVYKHYKIPRLHIFITVGDGCAEIIFGKVCRVLLFIPPAFSFISHDLVFDWNVTNKLLFSVWWWKTPNTACSRLKLLVGKIIRFCVTRFSG